ncbi:MAG: efflux RND transporter periplasmic adaptor subunit [Bacteroides intestinalis]|nr:efflux RND transporter periplasmic adaptor subunit [Bacteroides intestinalis]
MIKKVLPLIVLTLGLAACGSSEQPKTESAGNINQTFAANVKTTKATLSNIEKELTLAGKVISDPDKTITYSPIISGVIERTYFSLGDKVSKGQTLVDIRSNELNALQSELVALESESRIALREMKSAQVMFDDNMSSEIELLEAQGKVKQADAALAKVKADMAVFGTSKGDGTFSVKAPMSGYIISKNTSSGSTMSADSDPLFTIADLNSVWIIANVYASNLQSVKEGIEANITSISYPNEVFTGKVNAVSQVFDPEDKTLKARIVMPNKDMKLKPEMPVVIRFKNQAQNQLVCVPTDAVIFDKDSYFIVVMNADNSFSIKEITPHDHDSTTTYIASGLDEDENVVVKNQLLIYSELKVK